MEKHASIGFFLLNFAMQEGNNPTSAEAFFDLLIQPLEITQTQIIHTLKHTKENTNHNFINLLKL